MRKGAVQNIQSFQSHAPQLAQGVYVHASATLIGQVQIGPDSSIWPGVVIRGDVNFIQIGAETNIQELSSLHVNHRSAEDPQGAPLVIGNRVTIGHMVILHGCKIEDESLIGMGSIVMDKAVVHRHVLLAAGSLVPEGKVLESGYLYMGRPAKQVRALTSEEILHLKQSAEMYVKLKQAYLDEPV
ncbi:MAG: gamma carbonic anhydrase family protein [Methylophilaceae bacterium 17-44-8]|jgi:carbonic anhydrase/acetyltransferase-like protein (isoleucine patch superfamily)|nr:MAG: gamma carbonic anhydrase family protein [Methylophilales bacterium 28-44-11]OYZ04558.1 MAG: gamma carbonic anhydrase family protein [Methylophilales bacterium 16-45-7]OZA06309.1 MAG: gamma carbonic anhydrase family protein [Methylophilaceae bacterium 17-44-8]